MRVTLTSAMPRHRWSVASVRRWPVWALAPGARAYVIATVLAAAAFAVLAAWHTTWHLSQVPVYLLHRRAFSIASIGLGYGAASVEFHSGVRPLLDGSLSPSAHAVGLLAGIV